VSIDSPSPGRFNAENVWLRFLIQTAWDVKDSQLSGGPGWASTDRYDISAKAATGASFEEMRPMLQTLLEERFQLTLHRESKASPVYLLVVGKGGQTESVKGRILRDVAVGRVTSTEYTGSDPFDLRHTEDEPAEPHGNRNIYDAIRSCAFKYDELDSPDASMSIWDGLRIRARRASGHPVSGRRREANHHWIPRRYSLWFRKNSA